MKFGPSPRHCANTHPAGGEPPVPMAKKKAVAMEDASTSLNQQPHSRPSTCDRPRKRRKQRPHASPATAGAGSDSDSDPSPPSSPRSVRRLLEPYPKSRLLAFLADAAAADPALHARVRTAADASPSHRRLFVHGLPPRADDAALAGAFSPFGALADCHAVVHRSTGRCRGYGFVTFASRAAARRALRCVPYVAVAGGPVSAQLASAGPTDPSGSERRVYVTGVAPDTGAARMRAFFARFGELEGGPFGFDAETGRSRGYALLVYRTPSGAARAVEQPLRTFEGRALLCQLADEPARRSNASSSTPPPSPPAPALQAALDAVVAAGAGDLAACARDPAQAAALLGQNPVLAAAALSSALASAAAARRPSAVAPNPAVLSSPMSTAELRPATAGTVPSPVNVCGGAGLLGPYKPPPPSSSTAGGTVLVGK